MVVKADFFVRKKHELGVSLNQMQQQAMLQTEGPLLLLASPGSGKTTTIIMRIGYLIEEKGINPSRIKAITFSRAAAYDMKLRFARFFPDLPAVDFSTIHGLAFEVVREYFRETRTPYQMIEGDKSPVHKKIILRNLFKSIVGEHITEDQMDELTSYISFIKNKMIPEDKWLTVKVSVPEAERIFREYETYKKTGTHQLLLDYDDMLTIANQVLKENQQFLKRYQQRYDYILTDESQDTSMVQHAITEKLVQEHQNLCVVADDDQAIYSWRGAEPSYLLNFKQVYPNATILFMEQNYRSSQEIVDAANQFIKRNKQRYDKHMFTDNPSAEPIKVKDLADYKYQAKYLVQEIQKAAKLSEVAVLYRNHSSSIMLMNEFDRAGIPFYMKDADNRFFSHWVVEDILNFMRMTFTDKRPDILEKIHLKFNGYISKQQMLTLKQIHNNESVFDNLLNHVQLRDYQVKQLKTCKETFREMRGMPPLHAIRVIRDRLGYEKALEKTCETLGFRKEYVFGILNTLEEIADTLETMEEFANRLKHLESILKLAKTRKGQNAVTFSTFHSAKGLEFERVYMIDLVEGIIPSSDDDKRGEEEKMEEATRLFYVGMTRAKRHLELIHYRVRDGKMTTESRFVTDVKKLINPKEETIREKVSAQNPNAIRNRKELTVGKQVKHRVFGSGEIIQLTKEMIEIQFQEGVKKLAVATCLEMGLLEKI
ncbi:ATP-dependent helicase [Bacillus sp. REN10]|uniref:ATP-dependent helicase n=1 Tax=Bacillus sp. REN10 TaxID=2782541 RepID=UPI00193B028B|nr:ATP-dependent helicase [Bacillus sp. REN10]